MDNFKDKRSHFTCVSLSSTLKDVPILWRIVIQGRMAEWSKALVLGTSHYGGAGLNPAPVI